MQLRHVPKIDVKYWCALILASVFGANTGDFFADVLNLGHLSGLPVLAALFALAVFIEKFDMTSHVIYFWFAIMVVRTAATNLGDISHDLRLNAPWVIATLSVILSATILIWQRIYLANRKTNPGQSNRILVTNTTYWFSMLLAGTLGTVIGDYFSFGLQLRPLKAAYVLGTVLLIAFVLLRKRLSRENINIFYYWLTVVLIRSAGTAAGDFLAFQLKLPLSTLLSGLAFIAVLMIWKPSSLPESVVLSR
ncbi:MAG: hypothetical protein P4L87_06260 [Formivibrio sp.]|nr:hypothetical protein [Formivibrio sp.]